MLFLLKAPPMALLLSFTAVQNYRGVLQMQITSRAVFYVWDSNTHRAITAELRSEHIPCTGIQDSHGSKVEIPWHVCRPMEWHS